jgi:hypothetical protein
MRPVPTQAMRQPAQPQLGGLPAAACPSASTAQPVQAAVQGCPDAKLPGKHAAAARCAVLNAWL